MFREMRRFRQQITTEECIQILKEQPRGVLSVLGDDEAFLQNELTNAMPRAAFLELTPEHMTGKLVNES